MRLLALNTGMGQTYLARLPMSILDTDKGLIEYPRTKTDIHRVGVLWPETIAAIKELLPSRRQAKQRNDCGLRARDGGPNRDLPNRGRTSSSRPARG